MANSVYDENYLDGEQKRLVDAYKQQYDAAKASGDQAGMDAAHAGAEAIRAQSGYSGGEDGSQYIVKSGAGSQYSAVPTVQLTPVGSNEDYIRAMYAALNDANTAQLTAAYGANKALLEAQKAKIDPYYTGLRNDAAGESERLKRQFNEYAAASGLNSGAGGQAELSRQNALLRSQTELSRAQAQAEADIDNQINQLTIQYSGDISAALAQGRYQEAAALLEDYQRAQQSVYDTTLAQYQLDLQANQMGYDRGRDALSDTRYADETAYERSQAAMQQAQNRVLSAIGAGINWRSLPEDVIAASGLSEAELDGYWAQYLASLYPSYGGSGGGYSSGGSGSSKASADAADEELLDGRDPYAALMEDAEASGHPQSFIANNYKDYGFSSSTGLYNEYKELTDGGTGGGAADLSSQIAAVRSYDDAMALMRAQGISGDDMADLITERAWNAHKPAFDAGNRDSERGYNAWALGFNTYEDYLRAFLDYQLGN